jgi:MFS family permease
LYGSGVLLSGFAPNLSALYLTHGVLGGIGLGLGYIVPLAVLIGWFPDKRGFITGLAVTGFGLGALVTGPLAMLLIKAKAAEHADAAGRRYFVIVVAAPFCGLAAQLRAARLTPGRTDADDRRGAEAWPRRAHAALVSSVVDAGAQRHRGRGLDLRRRALTQNSRGGSAWAQ